MAVNLQVSVGRNKYDLACEEQEKEKILALTQRLNKKVNILAITLGRLSDTVLLFLVGLRIKREIDIATNNKNGSFNDYLVNASKHINNIIPSTAMLNDKDERNRLFLSCLNLENELYNISEGREIDYLSQDIDPYSSQEDSLDNSEEIKEYEKQMSEMVDFFNTLADETNKISIKLENY